MDPRGADRPAESVQAPRRAAERDIERELVRAVEAAGGYCRKWTSPGCRGVPDRIVVLGSRTWFVEVKAPGRKPTAQQLREHGRIAAAGGVVWVVDSVEGVAFLVESIQR